MTRLNSSRLNSLALLSAGCGILVLLLLSLPAQGQFGDIIPFMNKKGVHRKELETGVKKYQSGQYEEADGIFKKLKDSLQLLPDDVKKDLPIWMARNEFALKRRAEGHEQLQRAKLFIMQNKPLEALPILKELITNRYLKEADCRERDELYNRLNNVPSGNYKKLMSDAHKAFDCKDYISALALAREAQKVLPWIHNPLDTPAKLIAACEAALQHEQQNPAPIPLPVGPPPSQPQPLPLGPPQAPPFPPPPEKKDPSSFSPMKGVKDLLFPSKDTPKEPGKEGPQIKDAPKPPAGGDPDGPPIPLPEPPPMTPMKTSDNRGPAPFTPRMSAQDLPPASAEPPAPGLVTAGGAGNSDGGIVPVAGFALPGLGDKNSPEELNRKRAVAQQLLKEGYNALSINDFDAARRFARQAQELRITYGRNDLTPDKLLDEITRREGTVRNQPGTPKAPGKSGEAGKETTPNMLPPPDFADAKPGFQPKTDPKSLVRQARELLNKERFDEAERLINLAADAKYKWGLFDRDTPDHLRADLIKMRTRREREEAALCLREGRKKLKEGNLEEAKKLAFDAQRLHGPYTVMDGIGDRPQALLADISKAEQRLGKSKNNPTDPFAENNSDRVKGQLVSRTVENEKKARALALMIEARDLQAKNLLPEARAKAVAASKIQAAFAASEDNPELLLSLLTAQCGNALNTLLQQALDQTNSPDPGRFEKSLQMLGYARQLCMAFELDPTPIDQRADQVRQMQGTAAKTDKVVSPQQIQGLELLDQARLELKNGNTPGARRLAEKAFDKRYGVQEEAAQLLRSIDNAEFERVVKNANRDAQTGIAAFYAKDYRRAAALFASIDLRLLSADLNGRVRELLSSPELQRENLANAPPAKGNFATEKDPQKAPAKITLTDDPFEGAVAMQKIMSEKLRGESTRVLRQAATAFKTDPDGALDMLKQYRDEVVHAQLDPSMVTPLISPVERRINEYRTLIADMELQKEKKAVAKKGHDENKLNDAKFKLQEDMVQLNKEFQQLYREGKYIDAAAKCRLGLELDPDSVWATMGLQMSQLKEQLRDWERNKANNQKYFTGALRNNMADNTADSKNPYRFSTDPSDMQRLSNRTGTEKGLPFSSRSPEEQAIEYGLRKPISVSFKNAELKDVITSLRQMTGLNIVADKQAMDELGIGLDKRLSLDVDRIQLKSVLNMLLRPINMTYVIRDEVLQFTTELNSQGNCIKKVYPVADLVVPIMNNPTVTTNSFQDSMMRHILGQSGYTAPGMGLSTPVIPNAGLPPGQPVSNPIGGLGHAVGSGNYGPLSGPDAAQATLADQLIKLIQNIVAPNSWDAVGGQAKIHFFPLGMALAVSQTEDAHNEIIGLLAQLRKTQEVQVAIEMRIISVSESFFEAVQVNFNISASGGNVTGAATNSITGINNFTFGQNPAGTVPALSSSSPLANAASAFALPAFAGLPGALGVGGGLQMGLAFLNDVQVYMFMEAVRTDKRTQVMQAPKVTVVNATTANISINDQIFFTTGANLVQAGAQVFFMPQNNPFPVGVNLQVMPVVSADRRSVRLHLAPTLTNLVSNEIPTVPVQIPVPQFGPGGVPVASAIATMYFQQPRFSTISLTTTVNVPDGGTVLLGGLKTLAEARNESGPPVLADLPFINRLFRNTSMSRDSQSMMIMVTPRIIINEEEEQLFMGQMPPAVSRGY